MKTFSAFLKKYALIILLFFAVYAMVYQLNSISQRFDSILDKNGSYSSYQPLYTSEATNTDWAYPLKGEWKARNLDANPILDNVPNHIFYIGIFIALFAAAGFTVIFLVNGNKSWA